MEPVKTFNVLGVDIDILVPSAATGNAFMISEYTTPPGGGPPPHWHEKEDEIFAVIEGDFELLLGTEWKPLPKRGFVPALRNTVHTFRNSGTKAGKLLCIATPGGLDVYLEAISSTVMPRDAARLFKISEEFGISFETSPATDSDTGQNTQHHTQGESMTARKQFTVFGEPIEVVIASNETGESFAAVTQISPPGGGPPPHLHEREDEIFTVLEGEYEIFDGKSWHPLNEGETAYVMRNQVHTFRNRGTTTGKLQAIVIPGNKFETYLEEISVLSMPQDAQRLTDISDRYGIKFMAPEPVTAVPV